LRNLYKQNYNFNKSSSDNAMTSAVTCWQNSVEMNHRDFGW